MTKSLHRVHPVSQFSDISENRSKSARARDFVRSIRNTVGDGGDLRKRGGPIHSFADRSDSISMLAGQSNAVPFDLSIKCRVVET